MLFSFSRRKEVSEVSGEEQPTILGGKNKNHHRAEPKYYVSFYWKRNYHITGYKLQIRCISSSTVSTQRHAIIADLRVDALAWPNQVSYHIQLID